MAVIDFTHLPRRNKMYAGGTPFISDLQRWFYLTMLEERKRLILDFSLAALKKRL